MSALTDAIDTHIATILPALTTRQAAVLKNRGHYFQGLKLSTAVPADGALAVLDNTTVAPSYAPALTWLAFFGSVPAAFPAQIAIDQYVSPEGPGWVIVLRVIQASIHGHRRINVGPATWMDSGGWVVERAAASVGVAQT